ncbi:hypothetical protein Halru_1418 [Halovivax ruber XH-70]|uniref:Uncharacterized protein n=1 Tax=Halovivax ruber (strain DSM 18193 / JCM 13892 / XH-70) TaxID=797302 RepID=L0I8V4_HALRX|nr:DUF5804 family protein [Halovivax ruber]AGB16030.1 hypothetical protein Halru_1418 [Halovivax ruber XH-70]
MTRVCFVGDEDVTLRYELLSRETSRDALSTYDLHRPFENSIAVDTVSLGAAISLCNDLQWYVVRFVDTVLVQDPSVSETEWLSRPLARALRNDEIASTETGEYLKVYGVEYPEDRRQRERDEGPPAGVDPDLVDGPTAGDPVGTTTDQPDGATADDPGGGASDPDGATDRPDEPADRGRLVEPLYVSRTDGEIPEYDLREVSETVVVRLTEDEYAP